MPLGVRVLGARDDAERDAGLEGQVERVWAAKCAANPRFYNGPMLAFESFEAPRGEIVARREWFKRLAVTPDVATGVKQLGVTGVLLARDRGGVEHVLLGQRGRQTRVYGGLWELGPSGGVDPPAATVDRLDAGELWRALLGEIHEELGLDVDLKPGAIIAVQDDPIGSSFEVIIRVELPAAVEDLAERAAAASSWEYEATRWVPVAGVGAFDAAEGEGIIPPTRALFRFLGWAR